MRLYLFEKSGVRRLAIAAAGDEQWGVDGGTFGGDLPEHFTALITDWHRWRGHFYERLQKLEADRLELDSLPLLMPLSAPEKIICIGRNYREHAAEMGGNEESLPIIFSKFPSALIGPDEQVVLPSLSEQVDFEAELVVVIGRRARNVARSQAAQYIFGYTCGNDVSARDWQKGRPGGQWLLGKTFDTFAPIGPCVLVADQDAFPPKLNLSFRLNGALMQSGSTDEMIFPIDFLIEHLSKFFTLKPGDLIFTGTPAGVGSARQPPVFLKHGDVMEVQIAGIGTLRNPVSGASVK